MLKFNSKNSESAFWMCWKITAKLSLLENVNFTLNTFKARIQCFFVFFCKPHRCKRYSQSSCFRPLAIVAQLLGNKVKEQFPKRVFRESKARQIFRKTNISYPLIRTRTCVSGMREWGYKPVKKSWKIKDILHERFCLPKWGNAPPLVFAPFSYLGDIKKWPSG